jgi:hypothetical protein
VGIAGYLQASVQGQFIEDVAAVFKVGRVVSVSFEPKVVSHINVAFAGIKIRHRHLEGVPAIPATPKDREGFRGSLR